jgi:hypothetical protein
VTPEDPSRVPVRHGLPVRTRSIRGSSRQSRVSRGQSVDPRACDTQLYESHAPTVFPEAERSTTRPYTTMRYDSSYDMLSPGLHVGSVTRYETCNANTSVIVRTVAASVAPGRCVAIAWTVARAHDNILCSLRSVSRRTEKSSP